MVQKGMFEIIEKLYSSGLELIKRKNADYADGEDPFKNFKMSELVDVSPDRAILVRISDKLARVSNLLKPGREAKVKDEAVEDTILDMINYLALLYAYLKNYKATSD